MIQISQITTDALQTQTLVLPSGDTFSITMYYMPLQICWVFTNITYKSFIINNLKISNNPNLLYQWQNIVPFGIGCFSPSGREPTLQQDFASQASKLYILTQDQVQQYTDYIQGGVLPE